MKRKLVIKPLALKSAQLDDSGLSILRQAVFCIFSQQRPTHSFQDLYRTVESFCLLKKPETIFEQLRSQMLEHATSSGSHFHNHSCFLLFRPFCSVSGLCSGSSSFPALLDSCWTTFCSSLQNVCDIFT